MMTDRSFKKLTRSLGLSALANKLMPLLQNWEQVPGKWMTLPPLSLGRNYRATFKNRHFQICKVLAVEE